jgi:hypothetical protein
MEHDLFARAKHVVLAVRGNGDAEQNLREAEA